MASSHTRSMRTANLGVAMVAITAAVISFSHVRAVALRSGETDLTSWLLPISVDGAVVAAVSVLLTDSRAGRRPAVLTWLLLALGLVASLAANIASAEPTATARAVAAWPPLALALGIEVLAGVARRSDSAQEAPPAGLPRRPHHDADPVALAAHGNDRANGRGADGMTGTLPVSRSANGHGHPAGRRPVVDDHAAVTMIRELDATTPEGSASRLQIQNALGCGGSRAARLARLARQPVPDPPS